MKRERFRFKGENTNEISFPLGGIGTGCIGLSGNGRLIDWEIAGKPNKRSLNGFSHFAIRAEREGEVIISKNKITLRVLKGALTLKEYRSHESIKKAMYGKKSVALRVTGKTLEFKKPVTLIPGKELVLSLK